MSVRRASFILTSLGLLVSLASCTGADGNKPQLGKVRGKVTYNGKPVTAGHIVFTPVSGKGGETGQVATGEINTDGSYEMTTFSTGDGAILGQHIVTVTSQKGDMPKPDASGRINYVLPKNEVPTKYATADKSPLKCTVTAGMAPFEIELKD